jgi:hypothetical protein
MTELTALGRRSLLSALIEEARRRARRRRVALAAGALLALVIGGGIWAGQLALSGGGGAAPVPVPPGFEAVQAKGPVQHELLTAWTQTAVNGIPTGDRIRIRYEVWFDPRGGLVRQRTHSQGQLHDDAYRCPCSGFPYSRYWPVNPVKLVRRPGIETFRGREVIWIAPRQPGGFAPYDRHTGEWIALDARTHEPVASRYYTTRERLVSEARVVRKLPDIDSSTFWFVIPSVSHVPPVPGPPVFLHTPVGS